MKAKRRIAGHKEEPEKLNKKPHELNEYELDQVSGGAMIVNQNMAANNVLTQLSKNQGPLNKV